MRQPQSCKDSSDIRTLKQALNIYAEKHVSVFQSMDDQIHGRDPIHFLDGNSFSVKIRKNGNRIGYVTCSVRDGLFTVDSNWNIEQTHGLTAAYRMVLRHIVAVYNEKPRHTRNGWGNRRYAPEFNI